MKKYSFIIGAVTLAVISFVGFGAVANASRFEGGENVSVSKTEVVDGTLFAGGTNLDIASEVKGDLFCAGQNITISGTIHGDVICAGQSIEIKGRVDGDVRLAGQTVTLNSSVGGNATIASQAFTLGSEGSIARDATFGSANATLNGTVGRDVVVASSQLLVANSVGRDITGSIENLSLSSNAKVLGNIDYTSRNDLAKSGDAQIGGKVTRTDPPKSEQRDRAEIFGITLSWILYTLVSMLLVSLAIVLIIPRLLQRSTDNVLARPLLAPVIGIAVHVVVPIALILLAMTVVGIPLAILLGLIWVVILMLSGPFFAYLLGRLIIRDSRRPMMIMLVGGIALILMYFVPILGIIAVLGAFWYGTGMLVLELAERFPRPAAVQPEPVVPKKVSPKKR